MSKVKCLGGCGPGYWDPHARGCTRCIEAAYPPTPQERAAEQWSPERRFPWTAIFGLSLLAGVAGYCSLTGCASLKIAPCEQGVCYGTDPLPWVAGDDVTIPGPGVEYGGPFIVHFVTASDAVRLCSPAAQVPALACTYYRTEALGPGTFSTKDGGIVLPDGYSCVVVTPPVRWQYEHELRHCREGAWH
jgi:hypothetical protein